MGARAARAALPLVVRLRDRLPDGARHLPRRRTPRASTQRIGYDLARGRASPGRRRSASSSARKRHVTLDPRAAAARDRAARRSLSCRSTTRAACASTLLEDVLADDGTPDDRLRAGRRGEHRARSTTSRRSSRRPRGADAWVHVDGAFGLWAAASPALAHLVARSRRRRLVGDRRPQVAERPVRLRHRDLRPSRRCTRRRWSTRPPTSPSSTARSQRDPMGYSPEFSRRARSLPVWAAIRVARATRHRRADRAELCPRPHDRRGLAALPGCEILNDVVLNQVLLRFEDDERTSAIVAAVQHEGEAWMSPRSGRGALRSASRSRAGARTTTTFDARSTRSAGRRAPRRTRSSRRPALSAARSRELVDDGRVGERRRVAERPVLGDVAEQPAHDLAGARLRQLGGEDDVRRLRDRADLVRDVVAKLLEHLDRAGPRCPSASRRRRSPGPSSRRSGRRRRPRPPSGGRRGPTRPRSSRAGGRRRSSRRRRGRAARSRRPRRCGRRRRRSSGPGTASSTSRGSAASSPKMPRVIAGQGRSSTR